MQPGKLLNFCLCCLVQLTTIACQGFLGTVKAIRSVTYDKLIDSFKQMLAPCKSVTLSQQYILNIFQNVSQTTA